MSAEDQDRSPSILRLRRRGAGRFDAQRRRQATLRGRGARGAPIIVLAPGEGGDEAFPLAETFETLVEGVFVFDARGRILYANSAMRAMLELDQRPSFAEDATRTGYLLDMRDPSGVPLPIESWPLARLLRGEVLQGASAADVLIRRTDGTELLLTVTGRPRRDASGRIKGGVCVCHDVTRRHYLEIQNQTAVEVLLRVSALLTAPETQSELASLLSRVAAILLSLESADFAFAMQILDDTRVVPLALYGVSEEREASWKAEALAFVPEADQRAQALRARLEAGEVIAQRLDREEPLVTPRLTRGLDVRAAITAPVLVEGKLAGLLTIGRARPPQLETASAFAPWDEDLLLGVARLTGEALERGALARQLLTAGAARLAAEETTRQRDEFLSIASHELRTPLTSVKANAQLAARLVRRLQDAAQTDEQIERAELCDDLERLQEMLSRADRQAGMLARLVNDLVDVSRIHADRLELVPAPFDLAELVSDIVWEQRQIHPERRISVEGLEHAGGIPVVADADRIGQVLTNFLTNALKYSPEAAPVVVRVEKMAGTVRVAVADRGPGLSPEQRGRLFERFYRVPGIAVQSGSGVGLGIGLFIAKTIIERHSGSIGVKSVPGEGSTFWFELSLAGESC
jgi:signal transduction histidine kinase